MRSVRPSFGCLSEVREAEVGGIYAADAEVLLQALVPRVPSVAGLLFSFGPGSMRCRRPRGSYTPTTAPSAEFRCMTAENPHGKPVSSPVAAFADTPPLNGPALDSVSVPRAFQGVRRTLDEARACRVC